MNSFKSVLWVVQLHWFIFSLSASFQIFDEQKSVCIIGGKVVNVGRCNATNRSQQWKWTEEGKLLHLKTSKCLSISLSSPSHSRLAILIDCAKAPVWTCHEKEGLLEVANTSLFLRKQGTRVVVKMKHPNSWKRLEMDQKGNLANENICLEKGKLNNSWYLNFRMKKGN